jgi:hypothetical protein
MKTSTSMAQTRCPENTSSPSKLKPRPQSWRTACASLALGLACGAALWLPQSGRAANYTSTQSVAAGANWNGLYWSTNADGSAPLTGPPTAGNTYELLSKGNLAAASDSRTRNPASPGVQTFPGDSLQLDVNSDLRLKGSGAIVTFPGPGGGQPGLILNGGGINNGDDGKFWIDGIIEVRQQSYLFPQTSGATADNRGLNIKGQLIGTNNLAMINGGLVAAIEISGAANTFSGQWIVKSGLLLGSGNGSLGTNSITIDPNWTVPATNGAWVLGSGYNKAVVSIAYDLNSAGTLTIANGGQIVLYKNLCFSAVTINGTALSAGSHSYAELAAAYPNNILGNGYGHITVQPYGTPPSFPPPTTTPQQWLSADVGGPTYAGSVVTNGDGTLDVTGGGDDIWNATSRFHYYYSWASGTNWDITVQVKNFTGPDSWSKVELLVSPADPNVGPAGNDAFIAMMDTQPNWINAPGVSGVNNGGVDQFRTVKGGNADWLQVGNNPIPDYPANWLRINRSNSVFNLYRSSDGQFWRKYLTIDTASSATIINSSHFGTPWPNLVTVGVAVTAHNNGSTQLGDATIANLQATFPPAQPPTVVGPVQPIAAGVTNCYGCEASLSFVCTNNAFPAQAMVGINYQWSKNGSPIAGATNNGFYTWLLDTNDDGANYSCMATLAPPYNSISNISGNAYIHVLPGIYYTNGLKNEMFAGSTSRVAAEQNNVPKASWIGLEPNADDPGGYGNYYVNRVSGWFIPPTSDYYTFFVACDDDSDLFLSTDATMGNKRIIAQEGGYSGSHSWLTIGGGASVASQKRSDQFSPDGGVTVPYASGIPLTAGQPYFIELVHYNGTGGDNFAVTYQTTNMMADPNWAINFTNGAPSLMQAASNCLVFVTRPPTTLTWVAVPTNTTATLGLAGTFYSQATSDSELTLKYQWDRNGVLIPGATGSSYSIASVASGDSGAGFTVVATTAENELSITSSPPAILNVALPVLESGWAKMEYWYSPDPGVASFRVAQTNSSGVATNYALNSTYSTPANYTIFEPIFEGNSKAQAPSLYTSRLSTFFYPTANGNYVFFVNSDDPGDLYVSTNSSASNAVLVAQETGNSGSWNWNTAGGGVASTKRSDQWTAPDSSTPWAAGIPMIAGQAYYVAIIHADTGGGNNCEATFKLTTDPDPVNGTYSQMKGSLIKTYVSRSFSMGFSQAPSNVSAAFNGTATLTAKGATDSKSAIGDETDPSAQWTNNYVMYQWTRNGTPIPGATSSTFSFGPVSPEDSTANFVCQIRALGYVDNSLNPLWLNSSTVHITVSGTPVYETNFVLHAYYGLNPPRNAIRDGTAGNPDWLMAEPAFEADAGGTGIANNFGDELIGYFIPPTNGDYVFFCNSDDGAELYLSTDNSAINKRLIARETGYATALAWGTSGGTLSQVRSDTFVDPTTGTTPYSSGIPLIQGQKYFMQIVHSQGGGGSESCVTAKLLADPTPATGSLSTMRGGQISCYVPKCTYVTVTNQPQSVTTNSYSSVTFTAAGATDSTVPVGNERDWRTQFNNFLFYQWYKNGQPISGANASTLTLPNVLPSDNGAVIVATMRALGYADGSGNALWASSTPATLTVITSAPPTLVHSGYYTNYGTSVGSSGQPGITLHFSSPMDPTALLNPANYVLGGGLTIASILVNSNTYSSVTLLVNGTPTWPSSVTINNAQALGGGPALAGGTINVTRAVLNAADIGVTDDPAVPSYIDVFGANAFLVSCEGSDIWNTGDGINYLYEQKTGDFDVVVRQKSITKVSNWTKGGLMIRESLDPGSREWGIYNSPLNADGLQSAAGDGTGANQIQCVSRAGSYGASADWGNGSLIPPTYPNAWLRLSRHTVTNLDTTVHCFINGYYSSDGVNWTLLGQNDTITNGDAMVLPDTVYVGIASTAHHNDLVGAWPLLYLNTAEFDNYNSAYISAPPTVSFQLGAGGTSLVLSWGAAGHLESSPVLGSGAVWTPVGLASPATIPITTTNVSQFFRVVVP